MLESVRLRRLALICAFAIPTLIVGKGVADAKVDPESEHWVTVRVPHTQISLRYPNTWVKADASIFVPKPPGARYVFSALDPANGDDVVVFTYRRGALDWWGGLAEYKAHNRAGARIRGGKQLSASRVTIGHMPAFRSIDQFKGSGLSLLSADLQILQSQQLRVQIEMTTDADKRDRIEAVFDSVKPA